MRRYILYARKSQEEQNRQQQSIDDQVTIMTECAERLGLVVVSVMRESKSAMEPNKRPIFDSLMTSITKGEADAILCYHVNRLARNMVEGGLLQHLLIKGSLKEIRTVHEVFRTGDNILPFVLQTAMSTQYSLDLGIIVKRGLSSRAAKGNYPSWAPDGYINDRNTKTIEVDRDRFALLQQAWHLMLSKTYSLERLAKVMNQRWGYRTRTSSRRSGHPMSTSTLHRIFKNVFYTGHFRYNGDIYRGNHTAMVTMEQFESVQRILGRRGTTRPKRYEFAFTGLITCSKCGHMITAVRKFGAHKSGSYVYYRCANDRNCKSRPVREEIIEGGIQQCLDRIQLDSSLEALAVEVMKGCHEDDSALLDDELSQLRQALVNAESRRSRLVQLAISGHLTDEEFSSEKSRLSAEIIDRRKNLALLEDRLNSVRKGLLAVTQFAITAPKDFAYAAPATKKQIASTVCRSYTLDHTTLRSVLHPLLVPLTQRSMEPSKPVDRTEKTAVRAHFIPSGGEIGIMLEKLRQVWKLLLQGTEPLPDCNDQDANPVLSER